MFFMAGFNIMFFIILIIIAITAVKGLLEWNKNNNSPRLTVDASVVSKRSNTTHHNHPNGVDNGFHTTSSTTYYVTFQVESGDRMEFHVSGTEYGMLVEGDYGKLSFQGTRYIDFVR